MRGQGRVYRQPGGTVWMLDYAGPKGLDGRSTRIRASSGTTVKRDALEVLRQRIGDRRAGKVVESPDRVTFADLRQRVEQQYKSDKRRSLDRVKLALSNLEKFFAAYRAADITPKALRMYIEQRTGVSNGTIRYELAALRRGFRLEIEDGTLAVMPRFKLPEPAAARSGFFTEGELAAVLLELPADVRDLVRFLHITGWRRNEGRLLTWSEVDRDAGTVRLNAVRSKNGKSRVVPFALVPALKALIDARWEARDGLYVFQRDGQPIGVGAVRSAWQRATKRADVAGRLVHDLRRSAARDFRRAGVSEGAIMRLCGWETRSMFDRYNVIDEADLVDAMAKRFNGTGAACPGAPAESGNPLSSGAAT
jgi:integrase